MGVINFFVLILNNYYLGINIMNISDLLKNAGLKCTPQRRIVLEALIHLNNHPTADALIGYIHKTHPEIAQGISYSGGISGERFGQKCNE